MSKEDVAISFHDGRFHRQTLIPWWDQTRIANARVLVIGAGALGSEVLKTLALTGVGRLLIYDMDHIEASNLSRGVLFRESDLGRPKAEVSALAVAALNPQVTAVARTENALHSAGLGVFLWADIVIGCVDNREARIFVNSACSRTGRAFVDGGIEGFSGIVRLFEPAVGPCYECTMNEVDRRMVATRRSCAMLARDVIAQGHVPTTAVAAAIAGGLEAQEAIKYLHGQPTLRGEGLHIDGLWNEVSRVRYPRRDDCMGHETLPAIELTGLSAATCTLGALLERAERELGEGATLEISRDLVVALSCPTCGTSTALGAVLGSLSERDAACQVCGTHRIVETASSFSRGDDAPLDRTLASLGVPAFDIVLARQGAAQSRAWLLDGDRERALGALAPTLDLSRPAKSPTEGA